jgi:hypothetical protein
MIIKEEELERLNQVCVCVYVSPGQPLNIKCLALARLHDSLNNPQQQTLFQLRAFLFFSSKTFEK